MKYFYRIKTASALARFNKYCQRKKIKYFTIHAYGGWYGATNRKLELRVWDGILINEIK